MENIEKFENARSVRPLVLLAGRLDRRAIFITLAVAAVGAALYLGWGWLAAAGLTTFIVGLLPCAVMCGLGLCASRLCGKGQGQCHGTADTTGTNAASDSQSKP
ncbi:MAG: hypothetical protein EPN64_18200 [Burkholderiaceae bacterium]|nr:MAG: hypothetical protein EPN64_18200 [Burkholderiaceae bacterium]